MNWAWEGREELVFRWMQNPKQSYKEFECDHKYYFYCWSITYQCAFCVLSYGLSFCEGFRVTFSSTYMKFSMVCFCKEMKIFAAMSLVGTLINHSTILGKWYRSQQIAWAVSIPILITKIAPWNRHHKHSIEFNTSKSPFPSLEATTDVHFNADWNKNILQTSLDDLLFYI